MYSGHERLGVRVWYIIRLKPSAWARFAIWSPMFPRPIRPSWGSASGSIDYGERADDIPYIPANLWLSYYDPTSFLVGMSGPCNQLSPFANEVISPARPSLSWRLVIT